MDATTKTPGEIIAGLREAAGLTRYRLPRTNPYTITSTAGHHHVRIGTIIFTIDKQRMTTVSDIGTYWEHGKRRNT